MGLILKNIDTYLKSHPYFSNKDEKQSIYHFYKKNKGIRTKASLVLKNPHELEIFYESHSVDFSHVPKTLSETEQWFQDILEFVDDELAKFKRIRKVVGLS